MRFAGVKRQPVRSQSMEKRRRLDALVDLLAEKPMSIDQAKDAMALPRGTVRTYIENLHDLRRIHIADWGRTYTRDFPMFMAGDKLDVPKPEPKEEDLFQRPRTKVNVHRDPLIAAFFGESA